MLVIKKILLILVLLSSSLVFSQIKNNFWIYGKIIDSAGVVKDVNVVNLKTKKGTFSNDFGDYKMLVSVGDTVQFTSVNHQTVKRVINNFIYKSEVLDIFMPVKTVELDEFDLKRHDLNGFLTLDRKRTPKDRKAEALKRTMDLSNEDMRIELDDDHIDQKVRPPVVRTDPTMAFAGAGASAYFAFKYSERLWALRKKVSFQTAFPYLLKSEFGDEFFHNELKIPLSNYHHFLEYCNPLGIEDLYVKGRKIELINILRRESSSYLQSISSQE